ncbi:hypothetical protein MPH_00534 [Macrophomina phaseolina MS6]|uniref:Uncharacterized protein n=1 Tax=Macrophomina phaseolina (strain MS6) TaxID=1126212 RepID=K2SI12_MACPH|nr:hypothetical protein MPH_00534 [Macrophomina phaseolina MS6]
MMESIVMRSVSCSFPTKCLIVAATFLLCNPRMYAAASFPVRKGSSEKDSKLRPPRGERCKQTVGANRTSAPRALVSSPRCFPTSSIKSRFQVAAREIPQGNKAAYEGVSHTAERIVITTYWSAVLEPLPSCAVGTIGCLDRRDTSMRQSNSTPKVRARQKGNLESSRVS